MPYSQATNLYLIPIWSNGDVSSEAENVSQMERIEHILQYAMRFHVGTNTPGYGIVKEGNYTTNFQSGNSSVTLTYLYAVIKDIPISHTSQITWSSLETYSTYYLHVTLTETTNQSSRRWGHISPVVSSSAMPDENSLVLAKVVTTDSGITLYTSPDDVPTRIDSYVLPIHRSAIPADHPAGSITETHIADDAIKSEHIADNSIQSQHIASGVISTEHIASESITSDKLSITEIEGSGIIEGFYLSEIGTTYEIVIDHSSTYTFTLAEAPSFTFTEGARFTLDLAELSGSKFRALVEHIGSGIGEDLNYSWTRKGV